MSGTCAVDGSSTGDGAQLCQKCTRSLRETLVSLATLVPILRSVIAKEGAGEIRPFTKQQRGYVPENKALPYSEQASSALRDLYHCAVWAASSTCAGFVAPEPTDARIVGMLEIAAERVQVIRHEEDAPAIYDDVKDSLKCVHAAIDPRSVDLTIPGDQQEKAMSSWLEVKIALLVMQAVTGDTVASSTVYRWADEGRILKQERAGKMMVMPWSLVQVKEGRAA